MRCPHWDCGWCMIDDDISKEYKIKHQRTAGCCGSEKCPYYKKNIKRMESK